jgi:hypothetical protein
MTITRISTASTKSSRKVVCNSDWESDVHFPGSLACEDSSAGPQAFAN